MYYFGTNLENRFSVPDFWPSAQQSYQIPFEREEISKELERRMEIKKALKKERETRLADAIRTGGAGNISSALRADERARESREEKCPGGR